MLGNDNFISLITIYYLMCKKKGYLRGYLWYFFAMEKLDLSNKNLLLVEDSIESARVLQIFAEMAGAKVDWYESPDNALEALKSSSEIYDVVLSDISLPVMDGYDFCQLAKQVEHYQDVPFIALSGHDNINNKSESFGFREHIQKPIDPDQLMKMIFDITRH